jgi:PKD repeat protein
MSFRSLIPMALLVAGALQPALAQPEASSASAARKPHPARAAFPQMLLADRKSQGQRAVQLLGKRLDEVAGWYGKSPEEFRNLVLRDRRVRLDDRGRLFVEDELEAPLASAATPSQQSINDGTLLPLDQTFLLHSRPGAQRTIYLNFKGATLTNTAWSGSSTITAKPFDLDGLPYSNSTAELQRIQAIWQRVAEDYAPFDVDVTTEAPPASALTRSSGTDQVFGTTVLITNSTGVYSCSCGGVAYVGVFDDTSDFYKPALVFYNQLGAGNEKYVAEAISHEAGHNMGLNHDGTGTTGYYAGHGSGATGWAPIMGVGYYQSLVQWSKGQYGGANNTQDDYTVMASNGLPLRADDHGNTTGTATALTAVPSGGLNVFDAQGVIERPGDVDMFSFTAAAGTVNIGVSTAARSANLDALIELRNSAGTVLAIANPVDALNGTLSVTVPSTGTYFVSVTGTGKGDPLTTGYTNYGSLGNYAVQVTAGAVATGAQPPVAALSATPTTGTVPLTTSMSAAASSDPDGSIVSYEWTFGDGSTATGVSVSHVYTAAGTFTAQVKVTDNTGLSATRSVTIKVNPVVAAKTLHIENIAMSLSGSGTRVRGQAVVKVVDAAGVPLSGARVYGTWSGVVSGTVSGNTNTAGEYRTLSGSTRNSGTFTFKVTRITRSGYTYDSASNVEVSDSITR